MSRSRSLTALCALSLLVGLSTTHADAAPSSTPAGAVAPVGRRVANARALSRASFEALGDDDVVDVGDKQMSKRALLAHVKALHDASAARGKEADERAIEAARAAHAQKEKAAVEAANAPIVAQMSALRLAPVVAIAPAASAPAPAAPAPAPAAATPKLTGMLGQIKPGSAVILFGSGFGALEGEVRMYGTFPNGFIKLSVDSWGNGGIGVFIPQVTGVIDQQITLKIVTKAGAYSNYKTAPFTATRELRKVKLGEFTTHQCRDAALSFDACKTIGEGSCSSSVCGEHSVPVFPGKAESTDRFAATLKNGWLYESHTFAGETVFSPGAQEWLNPIVLAETYAIGNDKPTLKVLSTGSSPSFEVPWSAPALWGDRYKLTVLVIGPAGTSHV